MQLFKRAKKPNVESSKTDSASRGDITVRSIPSTFAHAAFPLGGIGTGNVSLGARGDLRDWELQNSPAKGRRNAHSFFAIHARPEGGVAVNRVLEARIGGDPTRDQQQGFWYGDVAGLPRMASARLIGEYPIARVEFEDPELPVRVALTAFTPFVPLDADASGIPATVLRYSVTNPGKVPVSVTIAGSLSHVGGDAKNHHDVFANSVAPTARQTSAWREDGDVRGVDFRVDLDPSDRQYGTMSLMTRAERVTKKPEWLRSFVGVGAELFWRDFAADGLLDEADEAPVEEVMGGAVNPRTTGSLGIVADLAPGETRDFEFVLAWSFPNRPNTWAPRASPPGKPETIRNHYDTLWPDAWSAGAHLLRELPRLEAATRAFHDALFSSSLDPAILDAVSSTLAVVRSTTCFRIEGGWFLGWEGSFDERGSCYGTCIHVWSYAHSIAWLFPELERSARRIEYTLEVDAAGAQPSRSERIFGAREATVGAGIDSEAVPSVDGQMGSLMRLHREWRFSGDDAFLRECWPAAVRAIEFAMREWDTDGDGILDARMHNTYDIKFYGPEPLGNIYFLAALKAMAAMARHLGEAAAAERYETAWARSSAAIDKLLYNGEYFQQRIDDVDEHRYQFGTGVLSDQTLGQLHAHLNGLGYLLPKDHVRSAVAAVYRHNFRPDLSHHESVQRVYALGDEGGLVTASWPRGGRPRIPFIYSDEVWTGIEYQVAAQLIFEGFVDEALEVVRAVRARYTGKFRSPWDDIELGHHYARSLSAWALLIAASGVQYDGIARTLSFDPIADGRYPFTTGTAWGVATITGADVTLDVRGGRLDLASVSLRGASRTRP